MSIFGRWGIQMREQGPAKLRHGPHNGEKRGRRSFFLFILAADASGGDKSGRAPAVFNEHGWRQLGSQCHHNPLHDVDSVSVGRAFSYVVPQSL